MTSGGLSDEQRRRLSAAPPPSPGSAAPDGVERPVPPPSPPPLVEPPAPPLRAAPQFVEPGEGDARRARPAADGGAVRRARPAPPDEPPVDTGALPGTEPIAAPPAAPAPAPTPPSSEPAIDTGALPGTAPIAAADLAHTDPTTLPPELHLQSALAIDGAPGAPPAVEGSALLDELFAPDRFVEWQDGAVSSDRAPDRAGPPTQGHIPSGLTGPQPAHDPWARTKAALAAAQEADERALAKGARVGWAGVPESVVEVADADAHAPMTRTQRALLAVAVAVVSVLALLSLFLLGSRLPVAEAGPGGGGSAQAGDGGSKPAPSAVPSAPVKPGQHPWSALVGGECLSDFSDPWAERFTVVSCVRDHDAQLVLRAPIPDQAKRYPGVDALQARLSELCAASGVVDLSTAGQYADLQISAAFPASSAQWTSGPRDYFCFVSRSSGKAIGESIQGTAQAGVWASERAAVSSAPPKSDG
ncbi:hypothetical protein [Schumannella soli]|uniref:Septum formation-related domain-containing protein n=1 Tax=Schumannella soli TaxID=2590779 RepID=A0A506Y6K5_9MICO|nr:hypothetical protein [Schumannella soli]TPW77645.1 hypothetical protein FJ657_03005 [Schumannella soli]